MYSERKGDRAEGIRQEFAKALYSFRINDESVLQKANNYPKWMQFNKQPESFSAGGGPPPPCRKTGYEAFAEGHENTRPPCTTRLQ
jgi:hypothetical protein